MNVKCKHQSKWKGKEGKKVPDKKNTLGVVK